MTTAERIVQIRKSYNPKLTQTQFAEMLGVSRSVIANLEYSKTELTDSLAKLICVTFGINWLWLKDGIGEMKNPPDTVDEMVDRIMTGEDGFKKSVFRAFARLGDNEWKALEKLYELVKRECK